MHINLHTSEFRNWQLSPPEVEEKEQEYMGGSSLNQLHIKASKTKEMCQTTHWTSNWSHFTTACQHALIYSFAWHFNYSKVEDKSRSWLVFDHWKIFKVWAMFVISELKGLISELISLAHTLYFFCDVYSRCRACRDFYSLKEVKIDWIYN